MIMLADALQCILDNGLPEDCNHCMVLCEQCQRISIDVGNGIEDCDDCRAWFQNDFQTCTVMNQEVRMSNAPICTKLDVLKKLLEIL